MSEIVPKPKDDLPCQVQKGYLNSPKFEANKIFFLVSFQNMKEKKKAPLTS